MAWQSHIWRGRLFIAAWNRAVGQKEFPISAAGVSLFAGRNQGFGNEVIIHHGFGIITVYAHLNKILVSVGDEVTKSQLIAESGNTGYSTGPHLHYEVIKDNTQTNPKEYLP